MGSVRAKDIAVTVGGWTIRIEGPPGTSELCPECETDAPMIEVTEGGDLPTRHFMCPVCRRGVTKEPDHG